MKSPEIYESVKNKGFSVVEVIVVIVAILIIVAGGYLYFKPQKNADNSQLEITPTLAADTPSVAPKPTEGIKYLNYSSEDGNLSFEYPEGWILSEIKNLETIIPQNIIDKNELTMPFILTHPSGVQITLAIYHFDSSMDLDAVMDSLKADAASLGSPYNEKVRNYVGNVLVTDSEVSSSGSTIMIRDLLFLLPASPKNTIYNISFNAPVAVWKDYEEIFSHVQSTAKLSS